MLIPGSGPLFSPTICTHGGGGGGGGKDYLIIAVPLFIQISTFFF